MRRLLPIARSLLATAALALTTEAAMAKVMPPGAASDSLPKAIEHARALIKDGRADEALKILGAQSGKGGDEARRQFYMARAHGELKHYKEAILANERAIALDPGLLDAYYNNACYAGRQDQVADGLTYLKRLADALVVQGDAPHRARYRDLLATDADMTPYRKTPDFPGLAERITWGASKAQYDAASAYRTMIGKTAALGDDKTVGNTLKKLRLYATAVPAPEIGGMRGASFFVEVLWDDTVSGHTAGTILPTLREEPNSRGPLFALASAVTLLQGNHRGADMKMATLDDLLKDPATWMTRPDSWRGDGKSTTLGASSGENRVEIAVQAALLPATKGGDARFLPVFVPGDAPPTLVVLATANGTSMTLVNGNNSPREDRLIGDRWGQRLFQNDLGMRRTLAADGKADNGMYMVVQIPLKVPAADPGVASGPSATTTPPRAVESSGTTDEADENAEEDADGSILVPQDLEGTFTEWSDEVSTDGVAKFVRDESRPVQITLQVYNTTRTGNLDARTIANLNARLQALQRPPMHTDENPTIPALGAWVKYLESVTAKARQD